MLYLLAVNKYIDKDFTIGYIHTPYTNTAIIDYIKNTNSNEKIHVTFQSERTANIIENLMSLDTCNLVCYQTSIEHHLLIYKMFEKVFISNGDDIKNGLPIT